MIQQQRNSQVIEIQRPDFFGRFEPNASWVHVMSAHMQLGGLRAYWPMSAHKNMAQGVFARDIACGYDLTCAGNGTLPQFGYYASATATGFPPWAKFASATTDYMHHADDPQFDILGTETHIASTERGFSCGVWVKFADVPASTYGIISKWDTNNQRAYRLRKSNANNIVFDVSTNGVALVTVTSSGTVAADTWYHIRARFLPSAELAVWIDDTKTTNIVGIPASIFNSTASLYLGRADNTGGYLNGKLSNAYIAAAQHTDSINDALYGETKAMYGKDS